MRGGWVAVLLWLGASGCYWSSPPTNPHGHAKLDPSKLSPLQTRAEPGSAGAPRLVSPRMIVFGRLDSTVTQPVGGVYDQVETSISPLTRTYYFRDVSLEIFEHTTEVLRAAGLDVRKDYATTGAATLLESRLRARSPLLMGGQLRSLQHDQIRTENEGDVEVARMVVQLWVRDTDGRSLYEREHTVEGKVTHPAKVEVLWLLGAVLAERLDQDAEFRRALGVTS